MLLIDCMVSVRRKRALLTELNSCPDYKCQVVINPIFHYLAVFDN